MDIVKSILESTAGEIDSHKSTVVHKDVELDIDVGTLLASDYNTLDVKALRSEPEKYVKGLTRDNVQLLINKIWTLPTERIEEAIVAKLPKPTFILPRSRAIPKPKPLTKWQQFAKEKGIRSKKKGRSKLKWDDELQKWIPTYGYKRAKAQEQKEWLVEVNDDGKAVEDPFKAAKTAKQERQAKNELQRLRNLAKSKNIKLPRMGLPSTEHFPDSRQISQAITIARTSTASVGKHQSRMSKEKDAKGIAKEVPGIKRKAESVPRDINDEKKRNVDLVDTILKSNTKIFNEDFSVPRAKIKTTKTTSKVKKGKKSVVRKGSKKPKAGKGGRDMRLKVGGRKRR